MEDAACHFFGAGNPAPYQRLSGTSVSWHSASQTSRAGTPAARAWSAVRPNRVRTRSRVTTRPYPSPNSSLMACRNSLKRIGTEVVAGLANHHAGVEADNKLIGNRVGEAVDSLDPFEHGEAIAYFTHDD